jgi:FlaA1/EpsC-like NDP-sugar epimerase
MTMNRHVKKLARLSEFAKKLVIRNRRLVVISIHLFETVLANYLAFLLRFEFIILPKYFKVFVYYLPFLVVIRLALYLRFRLHRNLWRYSSINDLVKIIISSTLGSIIFFVTVALIAQETRYPRSIFAIDWLILVTLSGGSRLFIRVYRDYLHPEPSGKRTLLIGAGDAGEMLVRDMKNNPQYTYEPIGFIDDDPYKKGLSIHGVPIFGPISTIGEVIARQKPDEITISMPSAGYKVIKEIYETCKPFNVPIKTLPGLSDILNGKISVSQIKPLSLEDLLQREPVRTDIQEVKDYIRDKTVLVTGAGGSIGSELCRQIAEYQPSRLVLFDRYENGLFDIDFELTRKGKTNISSLIGDIGDTKGLEYLFSQYRPQIVFHAAAHKHVPLMEHNPLEAVKNNVFGTKNIIEATSRHGAESFVMISTDKAVNPVNIMGATKRIAELLTISTNKTSSTRFTTVRFGNVLGSNSSVVNIFKQQLQRGGPLTVTHPEIERFFMLIPEAVQLVLIAAASGKGGEIFVFDMGEPIRIVDLAENIIRLSGLIPYEDIKIEFTGLRPGEKLYEELFNGSEKMAPTFHEKIRVAIPGEVPGLDDLLSHVSAMERIVSNNESNDVVSEIEKLLNNFHRQRHHS